MAQRDVDGDLSVSGDFFANNAIIVIDIGANASAARTAGAGVQYWIVDNGVDPINKVTGDMIFERPA